MITETMTVNAILRTWPEAQAVFVVFKIDCKADGSCFLDELCWRRGLDLHVLLAALHRVEHRQVVDRTTPQPVCTMGGGAYGRESEKGGRACCRL